MLPESSCSNNNNSSLINNNDKEEDNQEINNAEVVAPSSEHVEKDDQLIVEDMSLLSSPQFASTMIEGECFLISIFLFFYGIAVHLNNFFSSSY